MSLGMGFGKQAEYMPIPIQQNIINTSYKDEEAFYNQLFDIAYKKNVVVVLAAGNENILIGLDPMERTNKTINVSASTPNNDRASFSNFGNLSTISAPGIHIYSSVPNNDYQYLDGTSMAAPIVTGGVALIKSVNPNLTFDQIVELLQTTGLPISNDPERPIGNLMQLNKALAAAQNKRNNIPIVDCPDVQKQIDSLLQQVEKLRRQCTDGTATNDTLKIPPNSNNTNFAQGKWKSTTKIVSNIAGKLITIYFQFNGNGTGTITLVDADYTMCEADINIDISNNQLNIKQLGPALCQPPPYRYQAYTFKCLPDANNCAECEAMNQGNVKNKFKFKLVKML
jgi:subtilisin family serine protease